MEFFPRNEIYVTANRENGYSHTSFEELNTQDIDTSSLFENDPEKNRSTKEEIDIIDGVHFISFESESDLFDFTRKQKMAMEKLRDRRKKYEKEKEGRIIPTKTHDITKIKGWRNKVFITNLNTSSDFILKEEQPEDYKPNSISSINESELGNSINESELGNSTNESELGNSTNESELGNSTNEPELVSSTNEPEHKMEQTKTDIQNDTTEIVTADMISNNRIFLREFPDMLPRIYDICFNKKHSDILTKINNIYLDVIKKDPFLKKVENKLSDRTSTEGIFQCSLTDEFLEKLDNFEVSYANRGSRRWDEAKYEEAMELLSKNKDTKSPVDLIDVDDTHKKPHSEEVAEAFAKFDAFAEKTNKFKLKKYIVIKGQHVQLDFEKSETSDSDVHKSIITEDYNLTSSIKEEPSEPPSLENSFITQDKSLNTSNETNDPVFTLNGFSGPQGLLLALPCSVTEDSHPNCFDTDIQNAQLAVILNIGVERPLNEEIIKNFELLKKHPQEIDNCWANISASAVQNSKYERKVKRIVVPVVSETLKDIAKFSIEKSHQFKEIETDVKNVVEDAIDYIVRKEAIEKLDYPFDPDNNPTAVSTTKKPVVKKIKKSKVERELGRLINVTLVEENKSLNNNENNCGKEFCSKGCVCQSLEGTLSILHCKKIECMFECSCDDKNNSPREKIVSHGVIKNKLAKEESLWHKTVICKSNDVIIEGETGKSKREKKLPTRFRNNVLLYSLDISPNAQTNWRDNTIKHSPKGLKLSKKCDTKSISKIEPGKVLESKNSVIDSFKKPFPPKPKTPSNGLQQPKKSTESEKLSSLSKKNQPPKSFNSVKKPLTDVLNVSQGLSDNCNIDTWKEDFLPSPKKSTESEKLSLLSKKNKSPKSLNSVKEPLKDVLNVSKGLSDNCNIDIWKEDILPPDFDEESLIEMEEIIVSSDEEEDNVNVSDPLDVAYIWCGVHNAYNCQCCNSVFFLKTNTICRCRDRLTSFSRKHVSAALDSAYNFSMAHLHDRNTYSARTFGTHINYRIRNKTSDFKTKRKLEMNYGILSNTNSLYKLSILQLRDVVKKEKIVEDSKPCVTAHFVKAEPNDIVDNKESIDAADDVEEAEIDEVSKPLFFNQQPLSMNQSVHADQQEALGQSPQDTADHLISRQNVSIKRKAGSDADERSVEPEKENTVKRKKYRIGPAHFNTSRSYRTIVPRPKPKFQKAFSCDSKIEKIDKNEVSNMLSNRDQRRTSPPLLRSHQKATTDNLNSSVNIVSGKDSADSLVIESSDTGEVHKLGLLCLTDGFGYLPVNHFSSTRLSVRDPLFDDIYHNFKDLDSANVWLNRFFKNRLLFEDLHYNLKWVIIKPNLMARMKLFDKSFLLYDLKAVNKNGVLMDKNSFTSEYLRTSKKSHIQTYKVDLEQTSFPANNTIKLLLENEAQVNECAIPNKKIKTEQTDRSQSVGAPFSPRVVIDPADLQNMFKRVANPKPEGHLNNRLKLDTHLKRISNPKVISCKDRNVSKTTSEESPNKRMKLDTCQESSTSLKLNPNGKKPWIIDLGNPAPGSAKRYKIQIE